MRHPSSTNWRVSQLEGSRTFSARSTTVCRWVASNGDASCTMASAWLRFASSNVCASDPALRTSATIGLRRIPAELDCQVLALDPPELPHLLPECLDAQRADRRRPSCQHPHFVDPPGWLRAGASRDSDRGQRHRAEERPTLHHLTPRATKTRTHRPA